MNPPPNAAGPVVAPSLDATMTPVNEGSSVGGAGNPMMDNAQKFAQEQERLLVTYNVKVEHLEIANHIV